MTKTLRFDEIALSIADRVDDPTSAGVTQYVGLEHLDPDSIEITRFGTPEDVSATKLRFYPGDVIYARRRAYQKKLGVARFEGICSAHALVLRARAESCLPGFLPYFLHSDQFHNRALEISVGSLSPTINWSTLKHQVFRMPSLDEQERILELLSVVDAHAEALRNQATVAENFRRVVLHDLLNTGGEDWTETTLGGISNLVTRRTSPDNVATGIPYVGLDHVDPRAPLVTRWGEVASVSSSVTPFEPDDVLFGRLRPYLHKVAIADFPGVCSPEILVLRASSLCMARFLHLLCSTDETIKKCVEMSAGTRMPRTSSADLASIFALLPPLVEQKKIVDEISKIDALIQETNSALVATQQLRSALLNKEIS